MRAETQVELGQYGVEEQRKHQRGQGCQSCNRGRRWVEPRYANGGKDQLEARAKKTSSSFRQPAQHLNHMATLGHIGHKAALEIAIDETWNFFQESYSQTHLKLPAQTESQGCHR